MLRVAVAGALGRMGRLTSEAVRNAPDLVYAGGLGRTRDPEAMVDDDLERLLVEQRPEVLVDFTPRPVTQQVAGLCVEHGVVPVIGSSEWNDAERAELMQLCERHQRAAIIVPNFAMGAVLMMRFAEQAARFFPTVEIVELHHDTKRDKPSGTARATAARIRTNGGPGEVPIHSVRLRGLLAHQEVLLGNTGELLTIRHDSFSSQSFVAGILFAIRNARNLRGFHIGLDSMLEEQSA